MEIEETLNLTMERIGVLNSNPLHRLSFGTVSTGEINGSKQNGMKLANGVHGIKLLIKIKPNVSWTNAKLTKSA